MLFILMYKLVLEKERMFSFNRAYLLLSLISSILIPFISIPSSESPVAAGHLVGAVGATYVAPPVSSSDFPLEYILYFIYGAGVLYFLTLFIKNLVQIIRAIKNNKKEKYEGYTLVLLDDKVVPHSFMHYLFVTESEEIDPDILRHELTHIKQYHTLDIIAIELLKVIFWFNPAFYLYRSAAMLNHEFIADENVLKETSLKHYQNLLVQNILGKTTAISIVHGFNYSIIKKRLIMMTQKKSPTKIVAKAVLVTLCSICLGLLFVDKISAQTLPVQSQSATFSSSDTLRKGASEDEVKRYHELIEKYKRDDGDVNTKDVSPEDMSFLLATSKKMTFAQHFVNGEAYIFGKGGSTPKSSISGYDFDRWTNDKNYSIYIDRKKVANKTLKNHRPNEFHQYMLTEGKKEGKYRLDLTTAAHTAKMLEEHKKNPNMYISRVRMVTVK
jgi:bla regulator protein BlaR1